MLKMSLILIAITQTMESNIKEGQEDLVGMSKVLEVSLMSQRLQWIRCSKWSRNTLCMTVGNGLNKVYTLVRLDSSLLHATLLVKTFSMTTQLLTLPAAVRLAQRKHSPCHHPTLTVVIVVAVDLKFLYHHCLMPLPACHTCGVTVDRLGEDDSMKNVDEDLKPLYSADFINMLCVDEASQLLESKVCSFPF